MPRPGSQADLLAQFNELVPQAQALGIRVQARTSGHFSRSAMTQRLAALRASIAQFNAPSTFGTERTFGCEFEFHMPRGMVRAHLAQVLTQAGIPTRLAPYHDKTVSTTQWKLTTDGSLGNYTTGSELVTPKLSGRAGFELVQKALKTLTDAGCRVNKECGFHVHVGVKADGLYAGEQVGFFKNLLRLYRKFEPVIDSILALSRRGSANRWCATTRFSDNAVYGATSMDQIRAAYAPNDYAKYKKVNLCTYWRQGTVEFRHHQGTLNPLTATKWIGLVLRIVETASKKTENEIASATADLGNLLTLVGAEEGDRTFFTDRQTRLSQGARA